MGRLRSCASRQRACDIRSSRANRRAVSSYQMSRILPAPHTFRLRALARHSRPILGTTDARKATCPKPKEVQVRPTCTKPALLARRLFPLPTCYCQSVVMCAIDDRVAEVAPPNRRENSAPPGSPKAPETLARLFTLRAALASSATISGHTAGQRLLGGRRLPAASRAQGSSIMTMRAKPRFLSRCLTRAKPSLLARVSRGFPACGIHAVPGHESQITVSRAEESIGLAPT
jgi:hypothetical protein